MTTSAYWLGASEPSVARLNRSAREIRSAALAGTAWPLAADYYHGFRLDLDQAYVCRGEGQGANTLRVGFPAALEAHLAQGDAVGICPGQGPT